MYKKNYIKACLTFFISGIYVLSLGVILPDMIQQWDLSYRYAGLLLSMLAMGNLLANFLTPLLAKYTSQIFSLGIWTGCIPLGFLGMLFITPQNVKLLWLSFLGLGLGRGAISVVNNALVNDWGENKSRDMNMMHMIFAIGAFLSAFIILFLKKLGFNLNSILIYLLSITIVEWLISISMDLQDKNKVLHISNEDSDSGRIGKGYWLIAILMFSYVGVENAINGWFITYLKESNILSYSVAETLVSLTWLMIMFGRIYTAKISGKKNSHKIIVIYSIGASLAFLGALLSNNPYIIVGSMLVLGFCLAGIYPTSLANASPYVHGKQHRLALLMTLASLGGIFTPQLIGFIADKIGIIVAINILLINLILMFVLSLLSYKHDQNIETK